MYPIVRPSLLGIGFCVAICLPPAVGQCELTPVEVDGLVEEDQLGWAVAAGDGRAAVSARRYDTTVENAGAVFILERVGLGWGITARVSQDTQIFGGSVAMHGDSLAVGSTPDHSVYVYVRDAEGQWVPEATLMPEEISDPSNFASVVDLTESTLVAGSSFENAAHVFERDPNGTWSEAIRLEASQPAWEFGYSVAVDGNTAVVGAPNDFDPVNYSGSAWVFERDPNGAWIETARLQPEDVGPFWSVGEAVAISQGTIMVSAPNGGEPELDGAVFVYERDDAGLWSETAELRSSIPETSNFGDAIALDGDLALIGVPNDQRVFVFHRQPDGAWTEIAILQPDLIGRDDDFGQSIALHGNLAVAGAPNRAWDGELDVGAAFLFAVGPDHDGDGFMDACECPGDVNRDWRVDLSDLYFLLPNFGRDDPPQDDDCGLWPTHCAGDLDGDGRVGLADLSILLGNYNSVCP